MAGKHFRRVGSVQSQKVDVRLVAATHRDLKTLARQARRQAYASGGFLTGAVWVARGERLARVGLALAAVTVVTLLLVALLQGPGSPGGYDFGPEFD